MYQLREEKKEMKQFSLLLKTPEGWKAMNHKLSGAFIWEKRKKITFKKKSIKQKKSLSSVKSLVLNKATCSFSLSVPQAQCPFQWPSWFMIFLFPFCFCKPFHHTHSHTWERLKNPLELSQNEIKIQGIMCFDQHVSFVFVTLMVSLRLCVKKLQFRSQIWSQVGRTRPTV